MTRLHDWPALCSRVLAALVQGRRTASGVSRAIGVHRVSVSKALDMLQEKGAVKRHGTKKGTRWVPAQEGESK